MSDTPSVSNWNSTLYDNRFSYVSALAEELIALLAPQAGEVIIDLGCGTGHLTQKIAAYGAAVTGIDASPDMITQAQRNYPELSFVVGRGEDFRVEQPCDAVFSNAALHWMTDASAVVRQIVAALKPGGRLVAELGGKGNIQTILNALAPALAAENAILRHPWYFPSLGEYASLLEQHGFRVIYAAHFNRPTVLEGEYGLADWLTMFGSSMLSNLDELKRAHIVQNVEQRTRATLYRDGVWSADYVRLRVMAVKEVS